MKRLLAILAIILLFTTQGIAGQKTIDELTELGSADADDFFVIEDNSAGETKKIQVQNILPGITHSTRHERGGADEIDGDKLDIDWTPSNYSPDSSYGAGGNADDLSAHLKGVDNEIGTLGGILLRGTLNLKELKSKYVDTLSIDGLTLHINDGSNDYFLRNTAEIEKSLTGLSASTLYYVYIHPPASGSVITSDDVEINSTAPTWDSARHGYYHDVNADWRCIGEFFSKAIAVGEDYGPEHASIYVNTNISIDTSNKKWGSGALGFPGNASLQFVMSPSFDLVSGDYSNFTVEVWARLSVHSGVDPIFALNLDNANRAHLFHNHGGGLKFNIVESGSEILATGIAGEITDTNYHHIVLVKVGNEYGIYKDGIQVCYVNDDSTKSFKNLVSMWIGAMYDGTTYYFTGQMDDFRITHGNPYGAAPNSEKTDTISVPTSTTSADGDTVLLLHGEPITTIGATHFRRIGERVDFDDPVAIYSNAPLQTHWEAMALPANVPQYCDYLDVEFGTTVSTTLNVQIVSSGPSPRNEVTIASAAVSGSEGQGPTGLFNNVRRRIPHLGGTSLYVRANYNGSPGNQSAFVWGYELRR